MNTRTAQGAIAWSVSLISIPFVAIPAYLVFGRSKFEGSGVAYEQRKHEIDALVARIRENLQPWNVASDEVPARTAPSRSSRRMARSRGATRWIC